MGITSRNRIWTIIAPLSLVLLLGLSQGASAETPAPPPDPERAARFKALVKESVVARESGDLARTAALLEQAIDIRPAPEMLNNLGRIYEDLGNYKKAVECYHRVSIDPNANAVLKRLDVTRIALLKPRLRRGWLRPTSPLGGARLYADGARIEPAPLEEGEVPDPTLPVELEVPTGALALELVQADGARSQVIFGTYVGGIRTDLTPALADDAPDQGRLVWEDDGDLEAVVINGYTLTAGVETLSSVHLAPGRYVVELRQRDRQPVMRSLAIEARSVHDLSKDLEGAPERAVAAQGDAGEPSEVAALPLLTAGGGTLSVVVGVAMLGLAASDRAEVEQATAFDEVTTMTQAEAYRLEDRANTYSTAGAVLVGVGAAGLGAAIYLWMTDDDDAEAPEGAFQLIPGPGQLEATWSF